jgi:hypothetical protein
VNKKEPRDSILYVRIKPTNAKWLDKRKKKLGYKSLSEFLDTHLDAIRNRKRSPLDSDSA